MKTSGVRGYKLFAICVLLSFVASIMLYHFCRPSGTRIFYFDREANRPHHINPPPLAALHDKWIVVTFISPPTPDIQYLATLSDWQVLVVGDVKTPKNWSNPNITFLSTEDQKNLDYRITSLLPENSYSRKNIGYLFAIAHGAQIIYDTDDDNRPTDRLLDHFDLGTTSRGLVYANSNITLLVNPYRHFTQMNIWPRGFPLEAISQRYNANRWICSGGNAISPIIQQGLVNNDPDVDAIFRLTRLKADEVPNVVFDSTAPPLILPRGVFAPFNSQNTLFHKKALWSLVLPITTTFRVCDIWRGYWAQALVWLVGGHLGFYPPNARQTRNPHSYLQDFREEKELYDDAGRLVKFLSEWHCSRNKFFECVQELSWKMVHLKFWKDKDAMFIEHWLKDLADVGYVEPIMKGQRNSSLCKENLNLNFSLFNPSSLKLELKIQPIYFNGIELITNYSKKLFVTSANQKLVINSVNQKQNFIVLQNCTQRGDAQTLSVVFNTTLLVIIFNFPHFENIPVLEAMYKTSFLHILYCGFVSTADANNRTITNILQKVSFVNSTNTRGYFGYECLFRAVEMGFRVNGYLVMPDDMLLNSWNLMHLNQSRIWFSETNDFSKIPLNRTTDSWAWWNGYIRRRALMATFTELMLFSNTTKLLMDFSDFNRNLQGNLNSDSCIPYSVTDIFYVPQRLADDFYIFGTVFRRNLVFLEFAVPTLLCGLSSTNEWEFLSVRYLSNEERSMNIIWFNSSSCFLHPFKLSQIAHSRNLALQFRQFFGHLSAILL